MLMLMYMYVCVHVSTSLSDRVIRNHACEGVIAYGGEWHDKVIGLMGINWEE